MDIKSVSLSQHCSLKKQGNIVYFSVNVYTNIRSFTIPEGYRPIVGLYVAGMYGASSFARIYFDVNGVIHVYDQYPTEVDRPVIVGATWITN